MSERDYVAADDLIAILAEKDAICGEPKTLPSGRVVACTKLRGHLAYSAPGCVWEHPAYTRARSERDAAQAKLDGLGRSLRNLLAEWEHGENSATHVEPGIAYCASELRAVLNRRMGAWLAGQQQCPICYTWVPSDHWARHIADEHTDSEIEAWLETQR